MRAAILSADVLDLRHGEVGPTREQLGGPDVFAGAVHHVRIVRPVPDSLAKHRRDSLEIFEQQNREDLAKKEREELAIIEKFLPKQMSAEELTAGEPFVVLNSDNYYPPHVLASLRTVAEAAGIGFSREGLIRWMSSEA